MTDPPAARPAGELAQVPQRFIWSSQLLRRASWRKLKVLFPSLNWLPEAVSMQDDRTAYQRRIEANQQAGPERTGYRRSGDPAQSSLVLLQVTSGTGSGGSRRGLGLSGGGRPHLSGGGRLGHSRRRSYEEVLVSLAFHLFRLRAREGLDTYQED